MTENGRHILLGVAVTALAIDFFWRRAKHAQLGQVTAEPAAPSDAGYTLPPMSTPSLIYQAGGAPGFNSNINVSVNPNVAQFLTHNYIPLFGFVGMGPSSQTVH